MGDSELELETHLRHLKGYSYDRSAWYNAASEQHSLYLNDAFLKFFTDLTIMSESLHNKDAVFFLLHGVRRSHMIWYSCRNIIFTAPPGRSKPLSNDEQLDLSRDINLIYMHARGVMDNFAWCFIYEKEPDILKQLSYYDVSLFSNRIRSKSQFAAFWNDIDRYRTWADELKERRDPVAHRIPLSVPPSAHTPEEHAQWPELARVHMERAVELDFEASEEAFQQMHAIGRFVPCFIHHPGSGIVPIYPTVPADMAHLIRLGRILISHISPQHGEQEATAHGASMP